MKNAEYGLNENLIFKEAVAFLKKKKTLTEDEYKLLDEESVHGIRVHEHGSTSDIYQ